MKSTKFVAVVVAASMLFLSACAGLKDPATQAVAAAETALAGLKDDAAKYLPDQLKSAEGSIASLKDSLTKGDYKAVMAGAPALMSSLDSLKTNVGAKLEEAKAAAGEWTSLRSRPAEDGRSHPEPRHYAGGFEEAAEGHGYGGARCREGWPRIDEVHLD